MRKQLLIIGPDDFCYVLQKELEGEYDITVCTDATSGVCGLLEKPDALILNLFLPGMDGLTFLAQNSANLPKVVLAITRYWDEAAAQQLHSFGVKDVFLQPCKTGTVSNALKRHL